MKLHPLQSWQAICVDTSERSCISDEKILFEIMMSSHSGLVTHGFVVSIEAGGDMPLHGMGPRGGE